MVKLRSALLINSFLLIFGKDINYTTTSYCTLPYHPLNGRWIYSRDSTAKPKDRVIITSTITFTCDENYKLYPDHIPSRKMCTGSWGTLPTCKKHCPSLYSSGNMIVVCQSANREDVSCNNPYEGTLAKIQCATYSFYMHCNENIWDSPLPILKCEQDCGLKSVEPTRLVLGGSYTLRPSKKLEYPWQVGIFTTHKEHVCSGSIISAKLVLTSSRCFEFNDPNRYVVVLGKNSKEYLDPRAQHSKIIEWHNDSNNIAIVVLQNYLKFTKYIKPVCLDYGEKFRTDNLITEVGIVTGWVYKKSMNGQSRELDELKVNFSNSNECQHILSRNDDFSNGSHEICATLLDEKICKIDQGAPLVILKDDHYYLIGIALSLNKDFCDSSGVTLYSSVRHHIKFIKEIYLKYSEVTYKI